MVPSAPRCSANIPSDLLPLGLCVDDLAISLARKLYALKRCGVEGIASANKAPISSQEHEFGLARLHCFDSTTETDQAHDILSELPL